MIADNLRKQGGMIPGLRPGQPTVNYLDNVLKGQVFIGAAGLLIITAVSYFFSGFFGANVSFGGTSLLIMVSVLIETAQQAGSMMAERNYKGFLE